ncbi:DUF480 domain-containing protein, partial [Klebsiella pneumoniae]
LFLRGPQTLNELLTRSNRLHDFDDVEQIRHHLERLAGLPLAPLGLPAHKQRHAWHLFILRIDAEACGLGRDAFMEALKARGIGSGIHFIASHLHHYYRQRQPRLS